MRGRGWFYHFLAERLGRSVHELKGSMGSREFESWKAYYGGGGANLGSAPEEPADGDRLYAKLREMFPER